MDDLRERFKVLDELGEPQAWESVGRVRTQLERPRRRTQRWLVAALALGLAAGAVAFVSWSFLGRHQTRPAESLPGRIAVVRGLAGHPEILIVAPNGSKVRHLAWGYDPAWSPDGTQIAFRAGTPSSFGSTVIEVVGAEGGRAHQVVRTGPSPLNAGRPTWSPDGRRIAFATYRGIMVMNADGADLHRLVQYRGPLACDDQAPSWSPDGSRVVFSIQCDGGALGLWVIDSDGSTLRPLVHEQGAGSPVDLNPVWSPDGTRIAFERGTLRGTFVYAMNADGGGLGRVVRGSGPAWSPDGTEIAFAGRLDVFIVRADGTHIRRVIRGASSPAWQMVR